MSKITPFKGKPNGEQFHNWLDRLVYQFNRLSERANETTTAELEDIANAANTGADKVEGYARYNKSTGLTVIASGDADGDVWVHQGTGNTAHTPS